MRHRNRRKHLGKTGSHTEALLSNLVTSLFKYERVKTTIRNAKAASRLAEKLITEAKEDTLHHRRNVARIIQEKAVVKKLFAEIGKRYREKKGGYTRIFRLADIRKGDGAQLALLDLVDGLAETNIQQEVKKAKKAKQKKEPKTEEKNKEIKADKKEVSAEKADTGKKKETKSKKKASSEAKETKADKTSSKETKEKK